MLGRGKKSLFKSPFKYPFFKYLFPLMLFCETFALKFQDKYFQLARLKLISSEVIFGNRVTTQERIFR